MTDRERNEPENYLNYSFPVYLDIAWRFRDTRVAGVTLLITLCQEYQAGQLINVCSLQKDCKK